VDEALACWNDRGMAVRIPRWLNAVVTSAALIALVTGVIALLEPDVPALGLGVLYLLAVVPIALIYGASAGAAVSVASILVFNFAFLVPRHSLNPGTSSQWELVGAFLLSSLVVSQLAARSQLEARRSARLADEQAALRHVATLVARGTRQEEVFNALLKEVGRLLPVTSSAMGRYDPDGVVTTVAAWSKGDIAFPAGSRWRPEGRNVTTIVFETGRAARIDTFDDASGAVGAVAREAGYRSAVGTPVIVEGRLWGIVTAASTADEPLAADTEARLAGFTELVATAISNAESRAALALLADQQAALRRVATLVAEGVSPAEVLSAIGKEVDRLFDAQGAAIARLEADGNVTIVANYGLVTDALALGIRLTPKPGWVVTTVIKTGRSARKDDYDNASEDMAGVIHGLGIRSSVAAPIIVEGKLWGVVIVGSRREQFPDGAEQRLQEFTELAATAIANAESRSELTASRARLVAASDETRRRIERDLHDGAQQQLVALALELRTAEQGVPLELAELRDELRRLASMLVVTMDHLREMSQGIHPAILAEGGLGPALKTLARRSPIPVEVDVSSARFPQPVEVAAYYVVSEALANVAKHARASVVRVTAQTQADLLNVSIHDDGLGGANPAQGSGLTGLRDRVDALGGSIDIRSPRGEGTLVAVRLPLLPAQLVEPGGADAAMLRSRSWMNAAGGE
jgi:signal transduction histidine kinase